MGWSCLTLGDRARLGLMWLSLGFAYLAPEERARDSCMSSTSARGYSKVQYKAAWRESDLLLQA